MLQNASQNCRPGWNSSPESGSAGEDAPASGSAGGDASDVDPGSSCFRVASGDPTSVIFSSSASFGAGVGATPGVSMWWVGAKPRGFLEW